MQSCLSLCPHAPPLPYSHTYPTYFTQNYTMNIVIKPQRIYGTAAAAAATIAIAVAKMSDSRVDHTGVRLCMKCMRYCHIDLGFIHMCVCVCVWVPFSPCISQISYIIPILKDVSQSLICIS